MDSYLTPPLARLVDELTKLPGVGPRTAQRLAFFVLRQDKGDALALADAIREVKETMGVCETCFNLASGPRCRICENPRRDPRRICVVEDASDIIPVEKTHEFSGVYHVLGGALSPIDGVEPDALRIDELVVRVKEGPAKEVVLATNPTTTGEATALYLADLLQREVEGVTVTRLARGLPIGAEIEYVDEATLGRAFVARGAI